MSYQDNGYSFMFILNTDHMPTWQLHNARGHTAIGLAASVGEKAKILNYDVPALDREAHISNWPVIDKAASQKEIDRLYRELQELDSKEISINLFTDSMFGASAEEQLRQTKDASNPKILAIGLFGESTLLRSLTKRLRLATY